MNDPFKDYIAQNTTKENIDRLMKEGTPYLHDEMKERDALEKPPEAKLGD